MKYVLAVLMLILTGLIARAPDIQAQEAAAKGMSAIDILEALTSQDPALRDRGANELQLMSAETGKALGGEVLQAGVREAQSAIEAFGIADTTPAAIAACVALDSKEEEVRFAVLDALVTMSPSKVTEAGTKHLTGERQKVLRTMVAESDYLKLQCEGVDEDDSGALEVPVRKALGMAILLDRVFGVKGMALLLNRIGGFMLGDEPGDDKKKTETQRNTEERLRRGALKWCEAIWVEDPAIVFNYSPIAPYADRNKAVTRINRRLEEMQGEEVEYGDKKFKGKRYGDYLTSIVYESDISGNRAAAFLRLSWWRGDDVIISGEGYAEAVDAFNKVPKRDARRQMIAIRDWWKNHRAATE
ncbi:MAG: hypothetical protein KDB90_13620 [Planctomycetes bacterium]|nr:hypothetical protein [Planctomycetota bacterium]